MNLESTTHFELPLPSRSTRHISPRSQASLRPRGFIQVCGQDVRPRSGAAYPLGSCSGRCNAQFWLEKCTRSPQALFKSPFAASPFVVSEEEKRLRPSAGRWFATSKPLKAARRATVRLFNRPAVYIFIAEGS